MHFTVEWNNKGSTKFEKPVTSKNEAQKQVTRKS